MRTRALLGIHLEGKVQEIAEDWCQVVLFLDSRGAVGCDQIKGA